VQDCHQLEIGNRALDDTVHIYRFAADLPDDERYNRVSQLRRAAVSVPMNMAEGSGCSTNPEFARFVANERSAISAHDLRLARMTGPFMQRLGGSTSPDR